MLSNFALSLKPPYYAVIFSSQRTNGDAGYDAMGERMGELAKAQPGYLGVESVRGADGFGITVSYWDSEANIAAWKRNAEHRIAQETGQAAWYTHYETRVARVDRAYATNTTLGDEKFTLDEETKRSRKVASLERLKTLQADPDWPKVSVEEALAWKNDGRK